MSFFSKLQFVMVGCDRSREFRACVESFRQRVLSGRLHLRSHAHLRPNFDSKTHELSLSFISDCQKVCQDIKMTKSKLSKLEILLQDTNSSSPKLDKLVDVIQHDIVDLNVGKAQLITLESRIRKELSLNKQHLKHFSLIVMCVEYHLSLLVTLFRHLLETQKAKLSAGHKEKVQKVVREEVHTHHPQMNSVNAPEYPVPNIGNSHLNYNPQLTSLTSLHSPMHSSIVENHISRSPSLPNSMCVKNSAYGNSVFPAPKYPAVTKGPDVLDLDKRQITYTNFQVSVV